MSRLRKKTLTLLIAGIMISMALAVTVSAIRGRVWKVPRDFATIQEAVDAASDGDTIIVGRGEWVGGSIDKALKIIGRGAVIIDGPPYPIPYHEDHLGLDPMEPYRNFGFYIWPEGSGTTISRFTFRLEPIEGTDRWLLSAVWARFGTDDVTVTHNKIYIGDVPPLETASTQAITNYDGSNWVIKHNVIINRGHEFFLGITVISQFEDWDQTTEMFEWIEPPVSNTFWDATGNVIEYNTIITETQCDGTGIRIGDFHFPYCGGFFNNKIEHNRVWVHSEGEPWEDESACISFYALKEVDTPWTEEDIEIAKQLIHDNTVMYNNLRGRFFMWPVELIEVNTISENRGSFYIWP